jgi:hypothetical protein
MKCRLKSSSAPRGVWPSPLASHRSFGPIKASQMSSNIPIRGRSRAAGLRGCVSRKSSTSSLMMGGSSSMGIEVIIIRNVRRSHFGRRGATQTLVAWVRGIGILPIRCRLEGDATQAGLSAPRQSRPQIMATEVVRLPPMLNVRNFFTFSIWRAPACPVSC